MTTPLPPLLASLTLPLTLNPAVTPTLAADLGLILAALLGGLVLGAAAWYVLGKAMGAQTLANARAEADRVIKQAQSDAGTIKEKAKVEALSEIAQQREAFNKEVAAERNKIEEDERRLKKREDLLDSKLDVLATKEKYLTDLDGKIKQREQVIAQRETQSEELLAKRRELLEEAAIEKKDALLRVAHLTEDQAKAEALAAVERQCQHEAALIIQRNVDRAEEESKQRSQEIVLQAIQRYASEHTADATVTAIAIPSDDMKGRVIGREGRNIRAFEKATGVDVIVDDTPGVVVVSCFDPIRRAVASESLQKLLEDGRIHPSRIEEVVEQVQKETQQRIIKFGRDACLEANLQGVHPRIAEMMGRLHYRTSYGQNILRHSLECAALCQVIADQLGLDGALARRCGFLHDIGKAMDHEVEGGHPQIGMDFCRKHGESEIVLNAIGGHHNDIPSISAYTPIVIAADAVSGSRPGARRETLERYIKRLEQLEGIATSMPGVKQAFAIQAGREVRVIVDPERVSDENCTYLARAIAKKVSEEMTFPGEIRVTVLRELRTVEYAR